MTTEQLEEATRVLHPKGSRVELSSGAEARVYPVALRDLAAFSAAIGRAIARITEAWPDADDVSREQDPGAFIAAITEVITDDLMELVLRCTRADPPLRLDDLELSDGAALIDAFLVENFDSPKRRAPLIRLVDRIVTGATGGKTSISAMLSRFSSPAATGSATSSTPASPDSHIEDGAHNSSGGI